MVIWITGLSGSGKSTLAIALRDLLKLRLSHVVLIDGDTVRETFGKSLGHSEEERRTQIRRIQGFAKFLADQDQIVIVAALYSHPELLNWNRENLRGYFEVYVDASMDLLRKRDQKSLYSMAERGQVQDVVGIDIPWYAPSDPDLVIDADVQALPSDLSHQVIESIEALRETYVEAQSSPA